jgi:hypothetical protein
LFDDRTGWIAGAIATVYPGAIATSVLVLSEAAFCPLMLSHLAIWAVACRAPSLRGAAACAILAGGIAGAATLVRPSWLAFTPLAAGLALIAPGARKRHAIVGGLMLLGLSVAMAPWWLRNVRVTGRFVPTTLQVGASLYDGLNPAATGASNMDVVPLGVPRKPQATFEGRRDRHLRAEAWRWARANPARAVRLAAVKLRRMWNPWPNEPSLSAWPIRLAVCTTYVPVLVFGLVGAFRTTLRGWPYVLCWLPAVYFTMLHVVFVGSIRYRQPAMLPLMVLAASVLVGLVRGHERRNARGVCGCPPAGA